MADHIEVKMPRMGPITSCSKIDILAEFPRCVFQYSHAGREIAAIRRTKHVHATVEGMALKKGALARTEQSHCHRMKADIGIGRVQVVIIEKRKRPADRE